MMTDQQYVDEVQRAHGERNERLRRAKAAFESERLRIENKFTLACEAAETKRRQREEARETEIQAALTAPQQRYLDEIRAQPGRKYNGRARRPLEALFDAGLVSYEFTLVPHMDGRMTEQYTCWSND